MKRKPADERAAQMGVRIGGLERRLAAVEALHPPSLRRSTFAENENMWCYECDTLWPCPTRQAAEDEP